MTFKKNPQTMVCIHKSAIIGKQVELGDDVEIGPYAIIEDDVTVGNETSITSHAVIKKGTIIGSNCLVDNFAVIGGLPQDESFDCKKISGVIIGDYTSVREHATVHRATKEHEYTKIGNHCMIQTGSHVAHDCEVGDHTVLANCSMLGGHVKIGNRCFIGGGASIHQFVIVGDYVILGGYSATALNLPPYVMAADRTSIVGLNLVGLKRADIKRENIVALKQCFNEFYNRTGPTKDRAQAMIDEGYCTTEETKKFLTFFTAEMKRGVAPLRKNGKHLS